MSAFPEKSVTKMYGSTLLALRGGGLGSYATDYITVHKLNGALRIGQGTPSGSEYNHLEIKKLPS